jgi:hypothetical protein
VITAESEIGWEYSMLLRKNTNLYSGKVKGGDHFGDLGVDMITISN